MERNRIFNVLSLIFNLSIFYFTANGMWYNFRTDVIRDDAWFGYTGFKSLRFFTVLSNVFVTVVAIILVIYAIKNLLNDKYDLPKWLVYLKFVSTTCVALTMFVVIVYLSPVAAANGKGYFSLFTNNNFFMHFLTPVLAICSFVFCEHAERIKFSSTWWTLLPVVVYGIVYFVMVVLVGEANGGWVDFYGFTLGGRYWFIPIAATIVFAITFALALLLRLSHNKYLKKIQE